MQMMRDTSEWDARVKETWDDNADDWKENSQTRWQSGSRKEIIPFLQKHVIAGAQLIDVGCGPGYSTHLLKEASYDVSGLDISVEMIEHAKETYADIDFDVAEIAHMPKMATGAFDAALVINVIEWAEIPIDALAELGRIIRPSGYLCIGILGPTAGPRAYSYDRLYGRPVIQNTMMPWEFLRMARENEWELVDTMHVWRKGVKAEHTEKLQTSLKQALSFMTVFMLRNKKGVNA